MCFLPSMQIRKVMWSIFSHFAYYFLLFACFEVNLYRLINFSGFTVRDIKEITRFIAQHAGENIRGEGLDAGIKVAYRAVIEAAGCLNFVFGVGDFAGQLLKVLAGAQLRIGLGDREETLKTGLELGVGVGGLRYRLGR